MLSAYEGNQPYIFVSYAHKDSREVFDLIEKLVARGYRIWYDEGIEPGTEWPENIANHLLRADMVLAMITNDSMKSVNCRREINFALAKNKPFLSVILEKTDIPAGMELQLSSQQSVLRYNYNDEERFLDKIESCSSMDICKAGPGQNVSVNTDSPDKYRGLSDRKVPKIFFAAGIGIVLAVLVFFIVIPKKTINQKPSEGSQTAMVSTDSIDTTVSDDAKTGSDVDTAEIDTSSSANDTTDSSADSTEDDTSSASSGSTAEDTGNAQSRWIYSVSEDETDLIYTFNSGPVIVMPVSWKYKLKTMEQGDYYVFYHGSSNNSLKMDGYDNGGKLFSLGFSTTQDYKDFPSYSELGRNDEGYFFLMYPTDFQGYADNERIYNEYLEMYQEISYVRTNSRFIMK